MPPRPQPHPLALFSLKPLNERARQVIAHQSNEHLVSYLGNGELGLNIGHTCSVSGDDTTLATLGRNGDVIVEGASIAKIQCSFEIDNATKKVSEREKGALQKNPRFARTVDDNDTTLTTRMGTRIHTPAHGQLSALSYLHRHSVIHGDVKPANVLVQSRAPLHVKLADLDGIRSSPQPDFHVDYTPQYAAPELLFQKCHDVKVDIWSLGVMALEFYFRPTAFPHSTTLPPKEEVVTWLKSLKRFLASLSAIPASDFTSSLLETNPLLRPTAEESLAHSFLAGALDPSVPSPNLPDQPQMLDSDLPDTITVAAFNAEVKRLSVNIQSSIAYDPVRRLVNVTHLATASKIPKPKLYSYLRHKRSRKIKSGNRLCGHSVAGTFLGLEDTLEFCQTFGISTDQVDRIAGIMGVVIDEADDEIRL